MHGRTHHDMTQGTYHMLAIMAVLSFISMYAMVNTLDNVFASFNQFYMAGLMLKTLN